ncbi:MAG: hypothetical protein AAF081_04440 [Actinomycetota bacterium]
MAEEPEPVAWYWAALLAVFFSSAMVVFILVQSRDADGVSGVVLVGVYMIGVFVAGLAGVVYGPPRQRRRGGLVKAMLLLGVAVVIAETAVLLAASPQTDTYTRDQAVMVAVFPLIVGFLAGRIFALGPRREDSLDG